MSASQPEQPPPRQPSTVDAPGKSVATGEKREPTTADIIMSPRFRNEIALALPKHLTPDRMARIALTELRKNPDLMKCNPASVLASVIQCSQLGLEPGSGLGRAYLVPFKGECTMLIGYKGYIELALRSGMVRKIVGRIVRLGDQFYFEYGLRERLEHVPAESGKRGLLTYAYAVAWLRGGAESEAPSFVVMDREEVEAIRRSSKQPDGPAWKNYFDEMARKTAIRKLCKDLPLSPEMQRAFDIDDGKEAPPIVDPTQYLEAG